MSVIMSFIIISIVTIINLNINSKRKQEKNDNHPPKNSNKFQAELIHSIHCI